MCIVIIIIKHSRMSVHFIPAKMEIGVFVGEVPPALMPMDVIQMTCDSVVRCMERI